MDFTNLWRRLPWRSKSMALLLILVGIIYVMIALFLYNSVRSDLTDQVKEELAHLDQSIAQNAADPLLLKDAGALQALLRSNNPLLHSVMIVDQRGYVVASTQEAALGERYTALVHAPTPADLRFRAPIQSGKQTLGMVWLMGDARHITHLVNQKLQRTISRLLVLGVATAIFGLVGAYLVSLAITRPVSRLMAEMEDMEQRLGLEPMLPRAAAEPHLDELHRLELAFRAMEQRLQGHLTELQHLHQRQQAMQCMVTIGEMSSQVAHEIRNALSSLRGAARYLTRYEDLEHRQEFIAIIEEEVQRLYDMTQGFLDFGRAYELHPEPVELCAVLARCRDRHAGDLDLRGATLEQECAGPMRAMLDPHLLGQCLSNLLLNACDAVPAQQGKIRLRAQTQGDWLEISVEDNGPGIPETKREAIFKPYITSKTRGSGLGLAVVSKIMMLHEGQVELTKSSLGGACFRLRFPLLKGPDVLNTTS